MDRNGYTLLIAGIGYLGYNLSNLYTQEKEEVVILTRFNSIVKRPKLYTKIRELNVKIFGYEEIETHTLQRVIERLGKPKVVYYLAGVNRGTLKYMRYVHGDLSYRLASKLYRMRFRGRYIHISAYNPGKVISSYIESKLYGESLLMNLISMSYNISILRPGLLVGLNPTHPEWKQLYLLSKNGISIESGITTGYTPITEIYRLVNFLNERDKRTERPIDMTIYSGDLGLITRVFINALHREEKIHIKLKKPSWIWKILPYEGELGFIRGFLYPHNPPKPSYLFKLGYRPQSKLTDELKKTLKSMEMNF